MIHETKYTSTQTRNISDDITSRVSTTTQPSGNDKYTRRTYAPATTPILKSPHIGNNFHSQYSSSVSKITNNNNNNHGEELINYIQLEPEPKQLLSNSDWIYNVIQFINLLCLLKLLSQQNTRRNDIVIYSYSNTLGTFNNKIQNQMNFKIKQDHHISHIKPESTAFFSSPLTVGI